LWKIKVKFLLSNPPMWDNKVKMISRECRTGNISKSLFGGMCWEGEKKKLRKSLKGKCGFLGFRRESWCACMFLGVHPLIAYGVWDS
jgi:hypothetical protein